MVGPTVASSHDKEATAKKDEFNYPGGEARISSERMRCLSHPHPARPGPLAFPFSS